MFTMLCRAISLVALGAVLSFFMVGTSNAANMGATEIQHNQYAINAEAVLGLINQDRANVGYPLLQENIALDNSAATKCSDMVSKNYWGHIAPDGKGFNDIISESGYKKFSTLGENLAIGQRLAVDVNQDWLASQSHKDNILNRAFTKAGVAVCSLINSDNSDAPRLLTVVHFADQG